MNVDHLYDSDETEWLRAKDSKVEGGQVERKPSLQKDDIADTISAFGNVPGGGLVVVGATSGGQTPGIARENAESVEFNRILDRLDSRPRLQTRTVELPGTTNVLFLVRVFYSPNRVITRTNGDGYVRFGAANRKLSPDELIELRYSRRERMFDEEPAEDFDVTLLDADLCDRFQKSVRAAANGTKDNSLELDLLNERLALQHDGNVMLSMAGELLLAKSPERVLPGAIVRVLRFRGTAESSATEQDREFRGPLPTLIPSVLQFVTGLVRVSDVRQSSGDFLHVEEYPPAAWEEAIVNAIAHRSYSNRHRQVEVKFFSDRMTVMSPGGLFGLVTQDAINAGPVPSTPRNRVLMGGLRHFQLARLRGEGSRAMRQAMEERGLPPPVWREDPMRQFVELTLATDYEARSQSSSTSLDWSAVIAKLKDPYALVRRQGLRDWQRFVAPGVVPPAEAISIVFASFFRQDVAEDEQRTGTNLLLQLPPESLKSALNSPAAAVLGSMKRLRPTLLDALAEITQRDDHGVDEVIAWLSPNAARWVHDEATFKQAIEWCFSVLEKRLVREPLLDRPRLDKVVHLAAQYNVDAATRVYTAITGRPPP